MRLLGMCIDTDKLLSKQDLVNHLKQDGASDRALEPIRERYFNEFGNELIWRYPVSDGFHLGIFIVAVQEGFLRVPYDAVDDEGYELLAVNGAALLDAISLQYLRDDWQQYSDALSNAMTGMLRILHGS